MNGAYRLWANAMERCASEFVKERSPFLTFLGLGEDKAENRALRDDFHLIAQHRHVANAASESPDDLCDAGIALLADERGHRSRMVAAAVDDRRNDAQPVVRTDWLSIKIMNDGTRCLGIHLFYYRPDVASIG